MDLLWGILALLLLDRLIVWYSGDNLPSLFAVLKEAFIRTVHSTLEDIRRATDSEDCPEVIYEKEVVVHYVPEDRLGVR